MYSTKFIYSKGQSAKLAVQSEKIKENNQILFTHDQPSFAFDLDKSRTQLVLGQIPSDFNQLKSDLFKNRNAQFRGVLDAFKFNNEHIGLWNRLNPSKNANPSIEKRNFVSEADKMNQEVEEKGVLMLENSSICKNNSILKFIGGKVNFNVTLRFKTKSNGSLWSWRTDNNQNMIFVYMKNGRLNLILEMNRRETFSLIDTENRYDDNQYHTVKFSLSRRKINSNTYLINLVGYKQNENATFVITVSKTFKTEKYFAMQRGEICLGKLSLHGEFEEYQSLLSSGFEGCLKKMILKTQDKEELVDFYKEFNNTGFKMNFVRAGCPDDSSQCAVTKVADDKQSSYLRFELDWATEEEIIGLTFKTTKPNGTLFYRAYKYDLGNVLVLEIINSQLVLSSIVSGNQLSLKADNIQSNDGKLHSVIAFYHKNGLVLQVDQKRFDLQSDFSLAKNGSKSVLFLSGTEQNVTESKERFVNFEGCFLEAVYNNVKLDFSSALAYSKNIELDKCHN
jgi:hypothetical protein